MKCKGSGFLVVAAFLAVIVGACSPKNRLVDTCSSNADCEDFERCIEGVCTPIECQHSGDCPSGEHCVDDFCVDDVACESDVDCSDPTPLCDPVTGRCAACVPDCSEPTPICDPASGRCVECAVDGDCGPDRICSGGVCASRPHCESSDKCEMGQVCLDGDCVPGCLSDRDCPVGQACLTDLGPNGTCVECVQPDDCGTGQICEDHHCVTHCTSDSHCTPLLCDQATNQCVACTDDAHCGEGEICLGFECLPGCRTDSDCPSGHCNTGTFTCVDCAITDDCPLGSLCIDEQCVVGCLANRDCPADLQCDSDMGDHGTCVECLGDADCDQAFRCVQGMCEFFCDADDDCQAPRPACDPGQGVCVECTGSEHCPAGTICVDLACVPGCLVDTDCPAGTVCDADLGDHGGCVECLGDGDCNPGYSCDGNNCIIEGSEMVRLPGGEFIRGSDQGEGEGDEEPEGTVTVPTFYMDRTEVTNDQYRACVQDGACGQPSDTVAFDDPARGDHPVVYVTWSQARDFCSWIGKGLPSEARWERAARGTADERTYPWGEEAPDCARVNYIGCAGDTQPVGSHPTGASPEGLLDMAGNVYEWVYDSYLETYYEEGSTEDPWGPLDGDYRVARGGGYDSLAIHIRVANRAARTPDSSHPDVGFRCSMSGFPSADFTIAPEDGPYDTTDFAVDASVSTDPNHPVDALEVRWDWEADDTYDTTWTFSKTASHRYAFHGIFRIRLQVRDPDGNTDTASQEVVAEGDSGWDGAACETSQDCAHGFICALSLADLSYYCREDCIWLLDEECHIPGRSCQWTFDPIGNACLPE